MGFFLALRSRAFGLRRYSPIPDSIYPMSLIVQKDVRHVSLFRVLESAFIVQLKYL